MTGEVIVMEPADYQNWLHLHAEGSMALQGRKVVPEVPLRQLPQRRRGRARAGARRSLRPAGHV